MIGGEDQTLFIISPQSEQKGLLASAWIERSTEEVVEQFGHLYSYIIAVIHSQYVRSQRALSS